MIYERAGRGKVFGNVMCIDSHLDKHSFAFGDADIWDSELIVAKVSNSNIRSSRLEYSQVGCSRLESEVLKSHILHSKIRGGSVLNAYVENSTIKGKAMIRGTGEGAKIIDSTVKGYAVVEGDALVHGITLDKRMRVRGGVWVQPPRYIDFIEPEIADIGVTEGQDGQALVGCTAHKMSDWIRKRKLFTKAVGWTDEMGIRLARQFEFWLDEPQRYN